MDYLKVGYDQSRGKGTLTCTPMLFELIRQNFSVYDETAKAKRRFTRNSHIPLRNFAITPNGRFDPGLLSEIVKWLKAHGHDVRVEMSPEFRAVFDSRFDFKVESADDLVELGLPLRDYQCEGVMLSLAYGGGTFIHPTGAGKTLLIASTIANILARKPGYKILVVTLTHLVGQFIHDFVSYGLNADDISAWTGDNPLRDTPIVVAGSVNISLQLVDARAQILKMDKLIKQTESVMHDQSVSKDNLRKMADILHEARTDRERFANMIDKNTIALAYFSKVDVLMIDEVHQCKKDNIITGISDFVKTTHKFGYSGTMPTDPLDAWSVIGKIGPVRQEVRREKLVGEKSISDVEIVILKLIYNKLPDYDDNLEFAVATDLTENFRIEQEFLHTSEFRNRTISRIAKSTTKNILIIVDRIPHGNTLLDQITELAPDKEVFFVRGDVEDADREIIKAKMEGGDNIVCIAIAKIFSTGVNVKNLHYILFANSWKARVSIIQSIGRGVRMIDGKTKVTIFDIYDATRYGTRHYEDRKKIYETEKFKYRQVELHE